MSLNYLNHYDSISIVAENVVNLRLNLQFYIILLYFLMQYNSIKIIFPNGRIKSYAYSAFDYFVATNELEHKEESIIIKLDNISKSFIYEVDELSGEMINKEYISIEFD